MLLAALDRALNGLPSQCAVCRTWPAQPVCERCVARFAQPRPRCRQCALVLLTGGPVCEHCAHQEPSATDQVLAAVSYAYPWSALVVDFKFHQHTGWARSFATLMRSVPWVEPAIDRADWVVPMPLAAKRLQERGFNQTALMARALEPTKVQSDVLLRVLETPPQSALARQDRLNNVADAFAIEPSRYAEVAGKHIVLLDDVMTSGASLASAARVLRGAGAAHITGLVFARTEA
ncbi:ComF family protein [Rhodoferax sp.]|uniref:ComF family protein n=1 Tax=Rhodoferax sp. TaxID=50421 RepID=UPI003784F98E